MVMESYLEVAGPEGHYSEFRFDADGQDTAYLLMDYYCDEPPCEGTETFIVLADKENPDRRIRFDVGLRDRTASWKESMPALDQAIATEMVQDACSMRMIARRRQVVRAWGLAEWAEGPPVSWDDRCYTLEQFAVNGEQFEIQFDSGGVPWIAFDQHCVNPTCDCQDVVLSFHDTTRKTKQAVFMTRLDLRTGRVQDEHGRSLPAERQQILSEFQVELGDWQGYLGLRRKFIREAAVHRFRAANEPVGPGCAKVGRNDPCPCGSGRKFKRCCL